MLACLDVDYRQDGSAVAACLAFEHWSDAAPYAEHVAHLPSAAPYVPGELWRRELPCLEEVLRVAVGPFETLVVDGYVVLDANGRPGLGMRLFEALEGRVAIVGVAKTRFLSATSAIALTRGASTAPLWISSVGLDPQLAVEHVRSMHGAHRIPTLLRLVDRKARDAIAPIQGPSTSP